MKISLLISSLGTLKLALMNQLALEYLTENKKITLVDLAKIESLIKDITMQSLHGISTINQSNIEKIKLIFSLRWARLQANSLSYFCSENSFNYPWYVLAKVCCSKPIFSMHAYQLLMPSILNLNEDELVQCKKIKDLPLEGLIPTDDYTKLISLSTAIASAEVNAGILTVYNQPEFCDRDEVPEHILTASEIKRFENTNNILWAEYIKIKIKYSYNESLRVTKPTILALIKLIEASVFSSGILGEYDQEEQLFAEKAYEVFYQYLCLLNKTEKNNLMSQVIRKYGGGKTFESLWSSATMHDSCITLIAKDLVRLVVDYEPEYVFKNKIVCDWVKIILDETNQAETNKFYDLRKPFKSSINSDNYYYQRLVRMLSLAMTYKFKDDELFEMSYGGIKNNVPAVVRSIILRITKGFLENEYLETYYEIQNNIVIEELLEKPNLDSYIDLDKTKTKTVLKKILSSLLNTKTSTHHYTDLQHWLKDIFQDNHFWFKSVTTEKIWAQSLLILNELRKINGVDDNLISLNIDKVLDLISKVNVTNNHSAYFEAALKLAEIEQIFQSQFKLNFAGSDGLKEKIKVANIRLSGEFNYLDLSKSKALIKYAFVERLVLYFCQVPGETVFFSSAHNNINKITLKCFNSINDSEHNNYLISSYNFILNEHNSKKSRFTKKGLLLAKSFISEHCQNLKYEANVAPKSP